MEQGIISSSGAKPPPAPCFQSIVKPLLSAENMPLLYYIAYECIRGVDAFEADLLKMPCFSRYATMPLNPSFLGDQIIVFFDNYFYQKKKNLKLVMFVNNCLTLIDGLHLTSWRPCWRYNTKEYVINSTVGSIRRGWLTLSATSREIDCKPRIVYS